MNNYKAETLAGILNDAKDAKPIEGMPNTYDPENYNKVFQANTTLAELQSSEWLEPQIDMGAFEWDKKAGRPKSIARYRPALLDLNVLTMNVYKKSTRGRSVEVNEPEGDDKKTDKKGKKTQTVQDTVLSVIFGRATVMAIRDMKEIGNAAKAQVFVKKNGSDEWVYEGSELVEKDNAYKYKDTLNAKSALKLMQLMKDSVSEENTEGDSLEDVA